MKWFFNNVFVELIMLTQIFSQKFPHSRFAVIHVLVQKFFSSFFLYKIHILLLSLELFGVLH